MYRPSDPQKPLFDAGGLLPSDKRERCQSSWAGPFREHALPILRNVEGEFSDLFDPRKGRPNRPVELVLGVLILKDMFDLTDEEALSALEFDARWWYAFGREFHELHMCQKTLHNFRDRLMHPERYRKEVPARMGDLGAPGEASDKKKVVFRKVTDDLIGALGVKVSKQRTDSTHILSNFAVLTRLGLFCETIRVFLKAVRKHDEKAYEGLPASLLKRHGEESWYKDARKAEGPRRLKVVARDTWRLIARFEKNEAVTQTEGWKLLKRLFEEQCEVQSEPREPGKDDDDHGEGCVPVELKEAKKVSSGSLQTPHDPAVTYSGHKGKGYSVQVTETCMKENDVEMITDVEVTPAREDDSKSTLPIVDRLVEAGHKPEDLTADTSYSGANNAAECAKRGVNLRAPAPAKGKPDSEKEYEEPAAKCPEDRKEAGEWLKQQEASEIFWQEYMIRAGVEATNSELKRGHGMRKLRVRREPQVKLAVYFKAVACNLKRALRCWLERSRAAEGAAALV